MRNISIQIDDSLFKEFSVACAEVGIQKKSIIISLIRDFLEDEEYREVLPIVQKRMKNFKLGITKTISHKDVWK